MEWISIKDRLPEFEKTVLLYWKWKATDNQKEYESYETGCLVEVVKRKTSQGVIEYPEFRTQENMYNDKPTHWAELEPPKSNG